MIQTLSQSLNAVRNNATFVYLTNAETNSAIKILKWPYYWEKRYYVYKHRHFNTNTSYM